MQQENSKRTVVGKITSVFGIKGWVKVFSYTEPMENLLSHKRWAVVQPGFERELVLEKGQVHGKGLIAKLKGFDDRDMAQQLCGANIEVEVNRFPQLEDGEYYWFQLEGLSVRTVQGQNLGKVDHLFETGANDVLVVRGDLESIDQRERLIPYLPDQVIRVVDLESRHIVVDWDPEF